jgi:hypothetical protein
LTCEEGRSPEILRKFYSLLLRTRQRHQLPPQPRVWFENLASCLGDALLVRVATHDSQPITATITLSYGNSVMAKYGASDERFHSLGGMSFLLWKAIQTAHDQGAQEYDFGRTDIDNRGLIDFKNNWGAECSQLLYYRYPLRASNGSEKQSLSPIAKRVIGGLPTPLLTAAGKLLYRHMG